MRISSAANGKKTGDGSDVGFFIPLPEDLALQFPSLGDKDKSPPHVTFLYVGAVSKWEQERFLQVAQEALAGFTEPVRAALGEMDYFVDPAKGRRVAVLPVRFSQDLSKLRDKLRGKFRDAGFQVEDSFPQVYRPHVTLAYLDGFDTPYEGFRPEGGWVFSGVEVWGLSVDEAPLLTVKKLARKWARERLYGF